MRKLFLALMLSSALGAIMIGGALAWTGSASGSGSQPAGVLSAEVVDLNATSNVVIPNNAYIKVANGGIHNTGDIALSVTGGSVTYTGNPICLVDGGINDVVGTSVNPGATIDNLYGVYLRMGTAADNACQNYVLPYTVSISISS